MLAYYSIVVYSSNNMPILRRCSEKKCVFALFHRKTRKLYITEDQINLKISKHATFKVLLSKPSASHELQNDMCASTELPALMLMPGIPKNWIPIGY